MAATVLINRWTGSGAGTPTDVTGGSVRASQSDSVNPGTANPIPIPTVGTNYSYWVTTRFQVTAAPSGTIDNLKFFTDGGNGFGTGVTCQVAKASTGANAGYRQATSAVQMTTGSHTGLDASPSDAFGYTATSPAPLALNGTITATAGHLGDFVVWQIGVTTTASPGTVPSETFSMRYDET